jgi:hypothetical protein
MLATQTSDMIFWLVLKLEISYRVLISWSIFGFF